MHDLSHPSESREVLTPVNDLNFPSGEGFERLQDSYSLEQMTRLSEDRLPLVTAFSGFGAERLAAKCTIPFRLLP